MDLKNNNTGGEEATSAGIGHKLSEMNVELIDIDKIVPDPLNTKNHPDDQVEEIARSMTKRWTNPILVDDGLMIVAGHGRRLAALKAGYTKVPVIVLKNLTEAERIEYQIFDNKSAEKAEWNMENLQIQIDRLLELGGEIESTGWSLEELEESFAEFEPEEKISDNEKLDYVPPLKEKLKSRTGDIWILGEHRLMCGDSTNAADVDRLMDGQMADMVFTDPPYGVSYKGTNNPNGREWEIIKNDTLRGDGLFLFLLEAFKNVRTYLRPKRAFYVFYANSNHIHFETALNGAGLKVKQVIIWNKGMVLGHSDYHWSYEPCLYGCRSEENCTWFGDRAQKTIWETPAEEFENWSKENLLKLISTLKSRCDVWDIKRDAVNTYVHPTQKPVYLAQRAMRNSSNRGEIILDLFSGSGSTIVAGENVGRRIRAMELDPQYCDIGIRRWQETFGKKAKRLRDGIFFDDAEEYGG